MEYLDWESEDFACNGSCLCLLSFITANSIPLHFQEYPTLDDKLYDLLTIGSKTSWLWQYFSTKVTSAFHVRYIFIVILPFTLWDI